VIALIARRLHDKLRPMKSTLARRKPEFPIIISRGSVRVRIYRVTNDPESSALRYAVEIAALNLLGGGGEQIEVPEIRQVGFNPPVKRNFWGAIVA
jgi:hypothetical protein